MSASCPVCEAEQSQGLLCHSCVCALEKDLAEVAAIVAELDISLSKQARIGTPGKSGLARERIPINVGAMQAADNLGNVLTTWARDVSEGPADCTCDHADLPAHFHMTPCPIKVAHLARITLDRPIVTNPSTAAARLLLSAIPIIRRHPAVDELVDEITDAVHQARRAVDRPADRMFVGPCMGVTPDEQGRDVTCIEDLYARPTASTVQCKVCGIEHEVAERRDWLLRQAADRLFTVREAAQMMGHVGGIKVTESTIRNYISAGILIYHGKVHGSSVIRLGDLLLVIGDIAERQEKRRSARSA